jgi:hypothetical protein
MNVNGEQVAFLPRTAVPAAGTTVFPLKQNAAMTVGGADIGAVTPSNPRLLKLSGIRALPLRALFEYGAAGTTAKFFLQSSMDGSGWYDVACFAFLLANSTKVSNVLPGASSNPAVATDGTLADDTVSGPPGVFWRVKAVVTGAYTTTFITITGVPTR